MNRRQLLCCPNAACPYHEAAPEGRRCERFYNYFGSFRTERLRQIVPRYQCRHCGRHFSAHTQRATYRQKRADLNGIIFNLLCSGMTQRRIARVVGCNPKTVARKFLFLANYFASFHEQHLKSGELSFSSAQFDEMESFEHTRLKPLGIALAVSGEREKVIDVKVAQLGYKGRLAALAFRKYGPREDLTPKARAQVLKSVEVSLRKTPKPTIISDAKPIYSCEIKQAFRERDVLHLSFANRKRLLEFTTNPLRRRNENDPLFRLNHTAARIRHDLSRMMRKVWTTTKKVHCLQAHLDLFVAYYNLYSLPA